MTQYFIQATIPNAQLDGRCQNSEQETDNDLPETCPPDPRVTVTGLIMLTQLQYSAPLSAPAVFRQLTPKSKFNRVN